MTALVETGLSIPAAVTVVVIDTAPNQHYVETRSVAGAVTFTVVDNTQFPVTQRSFRWRNDDGSESAATPRWRQGQNAPAPVGASVRLRVQLDSDINPLPRQYKLQYRKSTDTDWAVVPIGAGGGSGAVKFGGPLEFDPASGYSLPAASFAGAPFTIAAWIWLDSDPRTFTYYQTFWSIESATNRCQLMTSLDGHTMYWSTTEGGHTAGYMTYGAWYYVACVNGGDVGTVDRMYWSAGSDPFTTEETSVGPGDPTDAFYLGYSGRDSTARLVGRMAQVKIWTAALTLEEVAQERNALDVRRTDNLWAYYSFASGPQTTDESGNGHTLTPFGTPTVAGPPNPISIPAPPIYIAPSTNIDAAGENTTSLLRPPPSKTLADFAPGRIWDNRNGVEQVDF